MADIKGIIVSGVIPKMPNATTYQDAEALVAYMAHLIELTGDVRSHGQLWCADLNGDFEINSKDVSMITGKTVPTYYVVPTLLGDVNCDGTFDMDDVLLLKDCLEYVYMYDPENPGSDEAWTELLAGNPIEYEGETIEAPDVTPQGLVNARYGYGDKACGLYAKPWEDYSGNNLYIGTSPIKNIHYLSMLSILDNIYGVTVKPTYTGIAGNNVLLTIDVADEYKTVCDFKWYVKSPTDADYVEIPNSNTNRLLLENVSADMDGTKYEVEVWDRTAVTPEPRQYFSTLFVYSEQNVLWGDINGDNVVNILDIAKFKNVFDYRLGNVDLDASNMTDSTEASYVLSCYANHSTGGDEMLYDEVATQSTVIDAVAHYGLDLTKDLIETLGDVNGDGLIDAIDASAILDAYTKASTGEDNPLPILADTDYGIAVRSDSLAKALVMLPNETTRSTSLKQSHIDRILDSIKNNDIHLS